MAFETDILCDPNGPQPGPGAPADALRAIVAAAFAVTSANLQAKTRGQARSAFARQVAIYLAYTRLGFDYTTAGSLFGRDRTTAAHACRRIEERREDSRVDGILECLERAIDVHPAFIAAGRKPE